MTCNPDNKKMILTCDGGVGSFNNTCYQALVRREYVSRGDVDFRRYQVSFTREVLTGLGIAAEKIADPRVFKMDAVAHLELLDEIARRFAEKIDFTDPDGLELGAKPKLEVGQMLDEEKDAPC